MSEEIDSFQKRLDRLQNLNSIQGAGGGKRKGKAGGQAKLKPPESTDLLQSHGFLGVIDLIGEGPVDGFCLKDGTRATSSEILSSVFYNDTPIREDKSRFYLKKSIAPEDIQSMGKADKDGLTRGINNLIGNFEQFMGRQNIGVSFDSKAIIEVVPDNYKTVTRRVNYSSKKELEQAGASYGGYSGGYRGIKRTYYGYKNYYETRYTIRPFKALGLGYSNPFYLGFTVLYKNQNGKVIARRDLTPVNSLNKPSTYVTIDEMGRAESIVDPTRKNTNVFYGLVPVNVPPSRQTIVVRQIIREEDELSPSRRKLLNQAEETINNLNILKESIIENESIFDGRLGYIQYDVNRLVDLENETLYSDNATETIGFHLTDDNLYERFIKDNEAINTIQIPNGVVSVLPVIDEDDVITPQRGQIEDGFRIKEFFGGGLLFFYLGRDYTLTDDPDDLKPQLETGKFVTKEDASDKAEKLLSGINGGYDVVVLDDTRQQISIGTNLTNQVAPIPGDTIGKPIELGFFTTYNDQFNYLNSDIEYNLGDEVQASLPNHGFGAFDHQVNSRLLGPFKYGGDAKKGQGNDDVRKGGNMSTWMTNPPKEAPEFAYTHVITNRSVEQARPTVIVESLSDTVAAGDDIGKQLKQRIRFQVEYGFEGAKEAVNYRAVDYSQNQVQLEVTDFVCFQVAPNKNEADNLFVYQVFNNVGVADNTKKFNLLKTDGTLAEYKKGTSLEDTFFTDADRGNVYLVFNGIEITNKGKRYEDVADIGFNVQGLSQIRPTNINQDQGEQGTFLNVGALEDGAVSTTDGANFVGGVFSGPSLIQGSVDNVSIPSFTLNTKLSNYYENLEDSRRIQLGIDEGIDLKSLALAAFTKKQNYNIEGIVSSAYFYELNFDNLPSPRELRDMTYEDIGLDQNDLDNFSLTDNQLVFPGDSWKYINRYVKVRKLDYETESVLIKRDALVASITEIIPTNFSYPFSALVGQTLDARNFQSAPKRNFQMRMKRCLVPSNYSPLHADGRDKRFITSAKDYGLRRVFTFDGITYAKANFKNNFTNVRNFEVSFKTRVEKNVAKDSLIEIPQAGGSDPSIGKDTAFLLSQTADNKIVAKFAGEFQTSPSNAVVFEDYTDALLDDTVSDGDVIEIKAVKINNLISVRITDSTGRVVSSKTLSGSNQVNLFLSPVEITDSVGGFFIGRSVTSGTQIVDLKLKVNNELLMYFDGNVTQTVSYPYFGINDKFGNHAGFIQASDLPGKILAGS